MDTTKKNVNESNKYQLTARTNPLIKLQLLSERRSLNFFFFFFLLDLLGFGFGFGFGFAFAFALERNFNFFNFFGFRGRLLL